jgi:hypothetical protein
MILFSVNSCISSANCNYIQKNPWIHLMISKRIDTAIHEVTEISFCLIK